MEPRPRPAEVTKECTISQIQCSQTQSTGQSTSGSVAWHWRADRTRQPPLCCEVWAVLHCMVVSMVAQYAAGRHAIELWRPMMVPHPLMLSVCLLEWGRCYVGHEDARLFYLSGGTFHIRHTLYRLHTL